MTKIKMSKTKRRIFNTAVQIFAEKGYDNASIEEITAIAGVAKGSLYYHFEKKEDIFDMLLEEGLKLLKNNINIKTKDSASALEKIKAIILVQIKVTVKYEPFLSVVFSQIWGEEHRNIKCKKAVFEYIKFYDGDVEALASGIFGITCSSLIYRLKKNRTVNVDDVYEGFINTIVRGLSKEMNK